MDNQDSKNEILTPEQKEAINQAIESIVSSDLVTSDALLPQTLFLIPLETLPVFPGMMAPLVLSRPKWIDTIEQAMLNRGLVGLVLKKPTKEKEGDESMYSVGTVVRIIRKMNNTDGALTVLVHSLKRFKIQKIIRREPYIVAQVTYENDVLEKSVEFDALVRAVISQVKTLSESNPFFTEEMKLAMVNAPGPAALADLVAFALSLKREDAQDFLETNSVRERFEKLLIYLKREQEVADIQKKISEDVNQRVMKAQREYFLKEQLKTIRRELGSGTEEESTEGEDQYRKKIETVKLSAEAKKVALEELKRLESMPETSPEYGVIRNYLDWLLSLPWGQFTEETIDLAKAKQILDEDHYGIPKVKQRILEFLAVKKLNPKASGSILCLVGPPGVGKTSLGKSIARAMGRNFFRLSLGGMRDEAEIKGHRRTYIGAMPGKLISAFKRVGSQNPVLLLDEIDKLGASFQGDPASALLEVLDPEQNQSFLDHYLDVPFDLSQVVFIVTANTLSTIPGPLLDRMEVVEVTGYTLEEKQEIAIRHILPKEAEKHGLGNIQITLPPDTVQKLISEYAREPGMRSTQQNIAAICRKIATRIVENPKIKKIKVLPKDLYDYLGPEKFDQDTLRRTQTPGVICGLAWTPLGGQILFIEASDVPRKLLSKPEISNKDTSYGAFKVTGQLGDVMNESASLAYSYVKKLVKKQPKASSFFENNEIHVHIPAGAIPKDGPSAGVTMATALYSLVTDQPVKPKLAMTGELSLVGQVLPVGGIREKVLAAKRAGISHILLPKQNKKDLKEMPKENLEGLTFTFIDHFDEVLKAAFSDSKKTQPSKKH